MPASLERAIQIAAEAHANQLDKAGQPYILHPLRVMLFLRGDVQMIAGVLHDVIEDSDWTLEDIANEGFAPEIVQALDSVTRRDNEPYFDFIKRAAADPIGLHVKMADLQDNLDKRRGVMPTVISEERARKYRRALNILSEIA
jgi:(p)ppGpp synthase/HD superfamily hydrolase